MPQYLFILQLGGRHSRPSYTSFCHRLAVTRHIGKEENKRSLSVADFLLSLTFIFFFLFFFFFFAVLGLELRSFTWSHSTNPIFVKGFAQADF
jgi:hypothetical protein